MTIFALMIDSNFADPNMGADAEYFPQVGPAFPVRVITRAPTVEASFGRLRVSTPTLCLDVRARNPLPDGTVLRLTPAVGDRVVFRDRAYAVQGQPAIDSEHLVWTLDLVPL